MPSPPITLPIALPEDLDALKALVLELSDQLASRTLEIEHLKLLIAKLKRMQFGRKSEKLERQIEQLELKLEDLEIEQAETAAPKSAATDRRPREPRKPLPAHLPRETHDHFPDEPACPQCGGELKRLGEDVSEQLELIPARFKVIRHVRHKLACACCECIVQGAAPSRPIERGLAGPALMAHVMVSKYCDHQPLYRQSDSYAREGVELSRSTLADWVGQGSWLVSPLVDAIRQYVMAARKIHGDDTPVPVLAPGNGKTKTGRIWTYVRDDRTSGSPDAPAVWFAYSASRGGEHPQSHLKDFTGILQADAFAGYNAIYASGRVKEAACMAHARRKFHDLHVARPTELNTEALRRIGELYDIERDIRGKPPDERKRVRQARAKPLLIDLERWLRETLASLSQKSETSKAIQYALNQWQALVFYIDDGVVDIDNNSAERALRAVALGRKNYLHFGADSGGERAAAMYTLIGTCRLNGINAQAYLAYVFAHIAEHPINRIAELLPWAVADKIGFAVPV
jgi:transposase